MTYEDTVRIELQDWRHEMSKDPSIMNKASKKLQNKINSYIPEKVHNAITVAIREMVKGILFGAGVSTGVTPSGVSLQIREHLVREKIKFYRNTAAAEGAATGAAGFLV